MLHYTHNRLKNRQLNSYNMADNNIDIYRKIIPSLAQLNWHSLQFALYWAGLTEKKMRRGELNIKVQSYPACVACVQSEYCGNLSYGYSGQYKLIPNSFRTPLREMLNTLGSVGKKSKLTRSENPIGKCAEVCAVNTLLYDCEKCNRFPYRCCWHNPKYRICLDDLTISEAFRPRTLEHIDRCENCTVLFGSNY